MNRIAWLWLAPLFAWHATRAYIHTIASESSLSDGGAS